MPLHWSARAAVIIQRQRPNQPNIVQQLDIILSEALLIEKLPVETKILFQGRSVVFVKAVVRVVEGVVALAATTAVVIAVLQSRTTKDIKVNIKLVSSKRKISQGKNELKKVEKKKNYYSTSSKEEILFHLFHVLLFLLPLPIQQKLPQQRHLVEGKITFIFYLLNIYIYF